MVMQPVLLIWKILQFARIVMYQVCVRELLGETGQTVTQEGNGGVVSGAVLYNASGRQFYDKEYIEAFEAEQVNGKKVAGTEGVPAEKLDLGCFLWFFDQIQ
jgi:hypothetical protein